MHFSGQYHQIYQWVKKMKFRFGKKKLIYPQKKKITFNKSLTKLITLVLSGETVPLLRYLYSGQNFGKD